MKKSILIFGAILTIFSLTAFTFMNWGNEGNQIKEQQEIPSSQASLVNDYIINPFYNKTDVEFAYNVDSRFIHTITKEKLYNAKSIEEILPQQATESVEVYEEVKIAILDGDNEIHEKGQSDLLNEAQLALIKSTDYSSSFYITAIYKTKNPITGELYGDYLTYYITITPEREATFVAGHESLISYLKENSLLKVALVDNSKLKPGKISFVITPSGTVSDVKLSSTSGYDDLDQTMMSLISNMPGTWYPATNAKGKKVEQEFFFSFGIDGC